jgi:hypothetical protein
VYDKGNSGVPGERECKREKNGGEIQMWEPGERKQVLDGRRGKNVQNVLWAERNNRMDVAKWERETVRKERGKILNEDGRDIKWMKEIWKRREKIEQEWGGG